MKLQDLEYLNTYTIAAGQSFYRVQRKRVNKYTTRRGPAEIGAAGLALRPV